jgi:hypothetical protein
MKPPDPQLIRSFFGSKAHAIAFVLDMAKLSLDTFQARQPESDQRDDLIKIAGHCMETLYPTAVERAFRYGRSEIERLFLGSVITSFLIHDPLGLFVTHPFRDSRIAVHRWRNLLSAMSTAQANLKALADKASFEDYLKWLELENIIGREGAAFAQQNHVFYQALGYDQAFHITPQATFHDIPRNGRKVRVDLLVWIPARPELDMVVECDGFKWHKSWEKFVTDRQRDRAFIAEGFTVLRIAGSEIWNEPIQVGVELVEILHRRVRSVNDALEGA